MALTNALEGAGLVGIGMMGAALLLGGAVAIAPPVVVGAMVFGALWEYFRD